jgi:hypothetical protein
MPRKATPKKLTQKWWKKRLTKLGLSHRRGESKRLKLCGTPDGLDSQVKIIIRKKQGAARYKIEEDFKKKKKIYLAPIQGYRDVPATELLKIDVDMKGSSSDLCPKHGKPLYLDYRAFCARLGLQPASEIFYHLFNRRSK